MRHSKSRKMKAVIAFAILFPSSLLAIFWLFDLRVNFTASMPLGIWRVRHLQHGEQISRGSVVVFCPPDTKYFRDAKQHGILSVGACPGRYLPLMKTVVAIPGDLVEFSGSYSVNGSVIPNSTCMMESENRLCNKAAFKITANPYELWVFGINSLASFDSRYFGPIPLKALLGKASPMLVI